MTVDADDDGVVVAVGAVATWQMTGMRRREAVNDLTSLHAADRTRSVCLYYARRMQKQAARDMIDRWTHRVLHLRRERARQY